MTEPNTHLVERAAERMREASGLRQEQDDTRDVPAARAAPPPGRATLDAHHRASAAPGMEHRDNGLDGVGALAAGAIEALRADSAPPRQHPEPNTDAPQHGRVLEISVLERAGLVVGRKSRTRISEEFRIAVGHVLRALQTSQTAGHGAANIIMITSSRPGEGKSFTAINLAGCIAQQSQREVLLVDTDAKQRPLTFELGIGDAPGLLDLVHDPSLRIEDVVVPTAIPALSFVPIGARLQSNAEMPLSRPVSAVIERIGRRFANKVVVLDAPPCLSTSDPSALAPVVGQILMVVEAERTQRNELVAALELVRVCPSITLLLNKIQLTTSYTFGAYHYFGTYS